MYIKRGNLWKTDADRQKTRREEKADMAEEITAVPAPERSSIAETGSITARTASQYNI